MANEQGSKDRRIERFRPSVDVIRSKIGCTRYRSEKSRDHFWVCWKGGPFNGHDSRSTGDEAVKGYSSAILVCKDLLARTYCSLRACPDLD